MYAIIECGGKQYRVREGDLIRVEKLPIAVGSSFATDKVLLVGGEDKTLVGTPYVPGFTVIGKVLGQDKDKKILVFRYKPKKNIRVRYGHRQPFTSLLIERILKGGEVEPAETKTEKTVAKTAGVKTKSEKKETKAVTTAAPAEAAAEIVKAANRAKAESAAAVAPSVEATETQTVASRTARKPKAAGQTERTAKTEAASRTTRTTKAKSAKADQTEA